MTGYFKGFLVRYTGAIDEFYGGKFHRAVYMEGPKKGKTVHIKVEKGTVGSRIRG